MTRTFLFQMHEMKETRDIIAAYALAQKAGLRAALATVVCVEGSSYRRPGARMLVTEDGRITGAISGGCLEGDARRKALLAMEQRQNKLVTYDSMDEEGELFAVQLGCNGIVHILFEPIEPENPHHPVALLKRVHDSGEAACLATLFEEGAPSAHHPGTCLLLQNDILNGAEPLQTLLAADSKATLRSGLSSLKPCYYNGVKCTAFLDYIAPPVSLVIAGAGNDALPLASMAGALGWQVTVIDGRPSHATAQRFPMAHEVRVVKAGQTLPAATAYMIMSHNYAYDFAMLQALADKDFRYAGILGPRKKRERMLDDLQDKNIHLPQSQRQKIFGPAGLDLGAETAEEIALSILAEIQAVLAGRPAYSLKDKPDFIHERMRA